METKKEFFRSEHGMEALEGLLVITLTLFVLFFIWGYGFLLFQHFVVVRAANETASKIAQTYAYTDVDPITGYISKEMKSSLSPLRYNDDSLKEEKAEQATQYARWLLRTWSMVDQKGLAKIETSTVYDSIARKHIVVKITAAYNLPFGSFLEFFGIDGMKIYQATGRAECVDLTHYMNTVDYVMSWDDIIGDVVGDKRIESLEKILSFVQKLSGIFQKA